MLYQLYSNQLKKLSNDFVKINGPYDTYGKILSEKDGGVFLVRGYGHNNQ